MNYNKISLMPKCRCICDYLHISNSPINPDSFSTIDSEPDWGDDTILLAKFSPDDNGVGGLIAGNTNIRTLNGYEIRRRRGADNQTEHIATLSNDYPSQNVIDYMAANNTTYTYYLYPASTEGITFAPFMSEEVKTDWGYWSLLVVDESDEENVFYLNKMFKFELNLSTDDMTNNAVVTVTQNFTKYPTVQYAPANYWSGGLTSLCGFISCSDDEYIQTPDMIDELKALTTDTRRKFLKDIDGHVWEVKITAPITISTDDTTLQRVKSVKISWTEVGDATGISVINNPTLLTKSWVLTKTGRAASYIDYVWDNSSVWDNSKRWTGKEDILDITESNIGRDLYSEEEEDIWA